MHNQNGYLFIITLLALLLLGSNPGNAKAEDYQDTAGNSSQQDDISKQFSENEEKNGDDNIDNDSQEEDEGVEPEMPNPGQAEYQESLKYFTGDGVKVNISKGRKLLEKAASLEFSPAQNHLGIAYSKGLEGFPKRKKKAFNYFKLAAAKGNPYALMNYGEAFYFGKLTREDNDKALEIFNQVWDDRNKYEPEEEEYGQYQYILSLCQYYVGTLFSIKAIENEDEEKAEELLERSFQAYKNASEREHFLAMMQVALAYAFGTGVERDFTKANYHLDNALRIKNQNASRKLFNMQDQNYIDHLDVGDLEDEIFEAKKETVSTIQFRIAKILNSRILREEIGIREAIKWYELAADSGKVWAMLELAFIYYNGEAEQERDLEKAFHWFEKASLDGHHALGSYNTGVLYFLGEGTDKNLDKANEFFSKADKAHYYVGTRALKQNGADKILTYEEAREITEKAAKKRDIDAIFSIGHNYHGGWGYKKNYSKAYKLFKKAASRGHPRAQYYLGLYYRYGYHVRKNLNKAIEWYTKSAHQEYFDALFALGYLYGTKALENHEKQAAYYMKCVEQDPENSGVLNNLGVMHQNGEHFPKNINKALEYYKKAANAGSKLAAENIGVIYYYGTQGIEIDYKKAMKYLQQGAEDDRIKSLKHLAYIHEKGLVFEQSYEDSAYYYRLAALEGDKESLVKICSLYLEGKGVSQNFRRAQFWIMKLINQGEYKYLFIYTALLIEQKQFQEAIKMLKTCRNIRIRNSKAMVNFMLADIYSNPEYKKYNMKRSLKYMNKAAEDGLSRAQVWLGDYYLNRKDWEKAAIYYQLGAEQDNSLCQYNLGCLYMSGNGIEKNQKEGFTWIRTAAANDNPQAMISLGIAYLQGIPGAPPKDRALEYLRRAAELDHPNAKELIAKIEQK